MLDILVNGIIVLGCGFVFVAALGVLRLPDFYTRIHAATKAGAFGGGLLALAAGIAFMSWVGWVQAILIIGFFYITTPVAGHLLGRAAYLRKVAVYTKKPRL